MENFVKNLNLCEKFRQNSKSSTVNLAKNGNFPEKLKAWPKIEIVDTQLILLRVFLN